MELLVAILIALGVYVDPTKETTTILEEHPAVYAQAKTILDTQAYRIDPETGIIIIEDGSGDGN